MTVITLPDDGQRVVSDDAAERFSLTTGDRVNIALVARIEMFERALISTTLLESGGVAAITKST